MKYRPTTKPHPKYPRATPGLKADIGFMLMIKADLARTPFILALAFGWADL